MKTFHIDEPNEIGKKKQRVSRNDKMFFKQQVESVLKERKKMTEGNIKLKNLLKEAQDDTDSSVGLLLLHDKQLLCLKRTDSYWSIPKGRVQENESSIDAVHRELMEETQIVLNRVPEKLICGNKDGGGEFHLFAVNSVNYEKPVLNHEHEDWGYFEFSKLPAPFDKRLLSMKNDWYSQKLLEPHSNYQKDNEDVPV